MGLSIQTLANYCDELLGARTLADSCPNGLQVEGTRTVRRIVTGVSACLSLFEEAVAREADAVLVHHGLFWKGHPLPLVGHLAARIRILMASGVHLLAYHLPLDRHPELGNNVLGARALGLYSLIPFGIFNGTAIGCAGTYPEPITPEELMERARNAFSREPLAFLEGPSRIQRVGFISGSGARALEEASACGLDAFVTGEPAEWCLALAREAKLHFLACGHHATERLGIQALGRHLAERFQLIHTFIDIQNPV